MNEQNPDPVAIGSKTYNSLGAQFAASKKRQEQWLQLEAIMNGHFTVEERATMWAALDAGDLGPLTEVQRKVMEAWRVYEEDVSRSFNTDGKRGAVKFRRDYRLVLPIVAVALLLLALGWAFRWQVVETQRGSFIINRWTGQVRYLLNGGSDLVAPP